MRVQTPRGDAEVDLTKPKGKRRALLALGHGAGGDVTTADLQAVREAALAAGVAVALVTQPYRVAGRRSAAPATHLDEAWLAIMAEIRTLPVGSTEGTRIARLLPLIVGGRSSGARVACRTAAACGASGVVALAFPSHPPGKPENSRDGELKSGVPTLVVNGDRDAFGVPAVPGGVDLVVLRGETHDLRRNTSAVATAVVDWLRSHGWAA
jgi:predicted alpha/beta-hydrolase family hydrolase